LVTEATFIKLKGASGIFAARIEIATELLPLPTEFLAETLN
jgi:hypothetical protein